MLQQFLSTILAFVTSLFSGASLPAEDMAYPSLPTNITDYTTNISTGYCFDDFSFSTHNPEASASVEEALVNLPLKPTSADLLVQRCGGPEGQTVLTAKSTGDYEPYTYTLEFTDLKQSLPPQNVTFTQNFQAFGPGCRIEEVMTNDYSEQPNALWPIWQKILITCSVGDGGFSAIEQYSVDLKTSQVDLISRCDSRPIAILDSAGEVAHFSSASDCNYPFGTTEDGGIPYGNDGLE